MPFRNRYTPFAKFLCLLLALHFLNLSIDSTDPNPDSVPEDLSFNDIESVTEFLAEIIFHNVNAFAEHDEKDNSDGGSPDAFKFCCANGLVSIESTFDFSESPKFQARSCGMFKSPPMNVSSPPPKS
jgi:hypothetical protein